MMRGLGKSITFKWMLFSILLATVPLTIAGVNIIHIYQDDIKASVIQIEKEKADRVVEATKSFLGKATSNLLFVATDEVVTKGNPEQVKAHLNNLLFQNEDLFEVALLNGKGLETVKVSKFKPEKDATQKDQSKSEAFQVASKGQHFYGDFYYTSDGRLAITIAVPTQPYRGSPVTVLKARLDVRVLQESISEIKIGKEGLAYVMDREGFLVVHPKEVNIQFGSFADRAIAGEEGSLEFESLRGKKYLVVYKPIHELKWGVVVQMPLEEAYAPLHKITQTAVRWIIIALISAFALSFLLTRRFTLPIKQLSSEMTRVSKGDLDVHIEPAAQDEIGRLTESFNQMIQDLKQSQEVIREAEGKYRRVFENSKDMVYITSLDGKFIEVNQAGLEMLGYENRKALFNIAVKDIYNSSEDRERLMYQIAKQGFVKDFEAKLKRKAGLPFDVLITASAKRGPSGEVIGYEGIIKDISYRKKMEEELFQRTKELGTLYELSVLINQSLELDRVMPVALEKALNSTGFEIGTIYLLKEDGETLELKFDKNHPPALAENAKFLKKGEGVGGKAAQTKQPILISIEEYTTSHLLPFLKEEGVKTIAGIPLLSKGEPIGAMTLLSRSEHHLTQREFCLLESIGNQIGMALENAKLFSSVVKGKSEWETTFDAVTDLITIRDKDYRIIRANKAAFERWGLESERMIGKKCYEIGRSGSAPCENCYVTKTLKTKKPVSGERESAYLKGTFHYFIYPVFDASGEIVAMVDMAREVTEEKRLEKEKEVVNNINEILASSLDMRQVTQTIHSQLKKVMPSDKMTITLLDETGGRFRYFALEKDYAHEELTKDRTYPIKGTTFEQVMKTGQPAIVEDLFGSEVWLDQRLFQEGIRSCLVFPLEYQGKIIGTLNFGRKEVNPFSENDCNFIRQMAPGLAISIQNVNLLDEIRHSEEKYRTVIEGVHDGVAVIGTDYKFNYVNNRLSEILGYSKAELIGMDFRNILTKESQQLVVERYTRWVKKEENTPYYEFDVLRKDGKIRNMEIRNKELKDSEGRVSFVALMGDITEKKKMEEQLLQAEKLRALGEMASGVAHDFNNALAAILGNTQLLLYSVQEEEVRDSLKTIEKVAKDSAQTVKRLQEFTKKKARQELFKLDINSIIRDVAEITKPKWKDDAQGKGIPIEMVLQLGDLPDVAGNASEMREVIINVIFNAIEAMSGGGKIEIQTFKKGDSVNLRIADTGIGMDEETRKRIFEPFFTTKPFSNTGLGLSMSYGIIKRFGGKIEVESSVGVGTTFTIVLPVTKGGKEEVKADTTIKIGKSLRVLVIDDEETVRSVLGKLLSQANHRVTVAHDGEKGIQLFQEQEFDIVLTDLGMPGMSGWEVCQKVKRIKHTTPVGMITGWGMELSQDKIKEYGLDFILSKPFDFSQVVKVVSETIRVRA